VRIKQGSDKWFADKRIPADIQLTQDDYGDPEIDRGHMARREDPNWDTAASGATDVTAMANLANGDTFHYTNAALQHARLNQGKQLWFGDPDNENNRRLWERYQRYAPNRVPAQPPAHQDSDPPPTGSHPGQSPSGALEGVLDLPPLEAIVQRFGRPPLIVKDDEVELKTIAMTLPFRVLPIDR
jgi:hypothetical protein